MQLHRPPWFSLLACLAAAGAVRAQGTAPPDAAPAVGEAPAAAAPRSNGIWVASGLDWRLPPIFTSGSVSYDLRASRAADEANTLSHLVTTTLSAKSFIYQPWFATVDATLGLTIGRSQSTWPDGPFAPQERPASNDRFITGNARVDVFPQSRFPFEVHFNRSDSRVNSGLASSLDYQSQNIGFSQRYRPASGAYNLGARFDRREQFRGAARDVQNELAGDFSTAWKFNEFSLGLSLSDARGQEWDESSQFRSLVARHRYAPAASYSVETTVNWTQAVVDLGAAPSDISILQGSSVGLWRRDDLPLTLTGSVRGLLLHDAMADRQFSNFGATAGASYELSRNVRLSASAGANVTTSDVASAQSFSGSAGVSWQGDSLEFAGVRYDRYASGNAGGSVANSSVSIRSGELDLGAMGGNQTQTSLGAQLGHSISRSWPVTPQSVFALNAAQSLNMSLNRSGQSVPDVSSVSQRTLLHTLGAMWNVSGDGRSGYARISYSDSKSFGNDEARFQLFNFQLSGNFAFDRNRSLGGELTFQRTEQRTRGLQQDQRIFGLPLAERTGSKGASGQIAYRHQRLFGIPRLRFSSELRLAQDVLNQPGTFATIADRETRVWENRLDYSIGRVQTQLSIRMSQVDGKRHDYLMWRVQRQF